MSASQMSVHEFYELAEYLSATEVINADVSITQPIITEEPAIQQEGQEREILNKDSLFELPDLTDTPEDLPNLMEPNTPESEETSASELVGIRFPTVPKKWARPKGSCTKAIGLSHTRKGKLKTAVSLIRRNMNTMEKYIEGLFVDPSSYTD